MFLGSGEHECTDNGTFVMLCMRLWVCFLATVHVINRRRPRTPPRFGRQVAGCHLEGGAGTLVEHRCPRARRAYRARYVRGRPLGELEEGGPQSWVHRSLHAHLRGYRMMVDRGWWAEWNNPILPSLLRLRRAGPLMILDLAL